MINETLICDVSSPFVKYKKNKTKRHLYEKVIAKVGTFSKDEEGDTEITQEMVDHWPTVFSKWKKAGHKVTLPTSHKEALDVEANRGYVLKMRTRKKEDGDELVGLVEFADDDAAKLANRTDTSIYSPPVEMRGGKTYIRPITHVALTNDPVLPGLGGFKEIAASFDLLKKKKEKKVDPKEVLKAVGGMSDEEKKELFGLLQPEDTDGGDDSIFTRSDAEQVDDTAKKAEEKKQEAIAASHGKTMMSLIRENRRLRLDSLLENGKITPKVYKDMSNKYLGEESLTLSLSHGNEEFDDMMSVLEANDPIINFKEGEQTGPQSTRLSRDSGEVPGDAMKKAVNKRRKQAGLEAM